MAAAVATFIYSSPPSAFIFSASATICRATIRKHNTLFFTKACYLPSSCRNPRVRIPSNHSLLSIKSCQSHCESPLSSSSSGNTRKIFETKGRLALAIDSLLVLCTSVALSFSLFFTGVDSASAFVVTPPRKLQSDELATVRLFQENTPSVVYITNLAVKQDAFTLDVLEVPQGSGSGFVWDKDGHIVTNYHVIRGASDLRYLVERRVQVLALTDHHG